MKGKKRKDGHYFMVIRENLDDMGRVDTINQIEPYNDTYEQAAAFAEGISLEGDNDKANISVWECDKDANVIEVWVIKTNFKYR